MAPGGMEKLGDETSEETDAALRDTELEVLAQTAIDWERLRPQVTDQDTYDQLMAAVEESTTRNESLAQLKVRIQALGKGAVALAKKVASLVA